MYYVNAACIDMSYFLWNDFSVFVDTNRSEIHRAKILPVKCFCEVVAVVEQKLSVVQFHSFAYSKVTRSEIIVDLIFAQLKYDPGERRRSVVTILWDSLTRDQDRKRIAAIIWSMQLTHFDCVVD